MPCSVLCRGVPALYKDLCIFDKLYAVSFGEKCPLNLREGKRIIFSGNYKINDTCGASRVNLITVRVLQVSFFAQKKENRIMENSNYLGTERVGKLLRQFAIPCICSLIISCLYNIVDQIFVGNGS